MTQEANYYPFQLRYFLQNPSPYINVPFQWSQVLNLMSLNSILTSVYADFQSPIKILSAFRTPAVNHFMGGKSCSDYLDGRGMDITASDSKLNIRLMSILTQHVDDCDEIISFFDEMRDLYTYFHITISSNPRHILTVKNTIKRRT